MSSEREKEADFTVGCDWRRDGHCDMASHAAGK